MFDKVDKAQNLKRILVISNEPFSQSSSNGRTLMNMLGQYDKKSLGQFYIHGNPDREFCENYFWVSDRNALNAFLHKKSINVQGKSGTVEPHRIASKPIRRNCRNLVLRDMVWRSYAWWNKDFSRFLEDFSPEVVLLQAGDAPFMFAIAMKIAKRFGAALIMYNSENYVLKKYMFNGAQEDGIWHTILKKRLERQYARFMKRVSHCIYSMEQLEIDYQNAYPHPGKSTTLYTVSELFHKGGPTSKAAEKFRIVYCGNLGVGRDVPLAEFARVLYEVDPDAVLEIYGRFPTEKAQQFVCASPNVDYHGVVDYSEVPGILRSADMLFHCENPDRLEDLRTAFSTKIADCLAVGTPFLVYADRRYPFVQYLLKNQCAHIAGDKAELRDILAQCINNTTYNQRFLENAKAIALRNHSAEQNCLKFNEIVHNVLSEK